MALNFRNRLDVSSSDVQANDAFSIKIVAVAGYCNDWAAYCGPSAWSDEEVAYHGDKLVAEQAKSLFYVMAASGRYYRS